METVKKAKKAYLECGKVCHAHGVRGLVKVEPWCDSPKVLLAQKRVFLAVGGGYEERKILSASSCPPFVLLHIEKIDSREDAEAYKNRTLYLAREDIPVAPGEFLLDDLIGLPVVDATSGKTYGRLTDVDDAPAGRLYTVATEKGDVLLPAVKEFIKEIDPDRAMFVTPIAGFFDDEI